MATTLTLNKIQGNEALVLNKKDSLMLQNSNDGRLQALERLQIQLDELKALHKMEQDLSIATGTSNTETESSVKRRVSHEEIANMLHDKYESKMMYRDIADKYGRPIHTVIDVIKRERSEEQADMDLDITHIVPNECIIKHPKNERMARLCQLYYTKDVNGKPVYKKAEVEAILREEGHVVNNGTFQQVYNYVDPNRRCCFGYYDEEFPSLETEDIWFSEEQELMDQVGTILIDNKVEFWKILEINKILGS